MMARDDCRARKGPSAEKAGRASSEREEKTQRRRGKKKGLALRIQAGLQQSREELLLLKGEGRGGVDWMRPAG